MTYTKAPAVRIKPGAFSWYQGAAFVLTSQAQLSWSLSTLFTI
jgi:hypothetical protein